MQIKGLQLCTVFIGGQNRRGFGKKYCPFYDAYQTIGLNCENGFLE
jgi:hypothetical protein